MLFAHVIPTTHSDEAMLSTGYSPFINFTIEDFDNTMYRLLRLGATLDGPIRYPLHGKVWFQLPCLVFCMQRKVLG